MSVVCTCNVCVVVIPVEQHIISQCFVGFDMVKVDVSVFHICRITVFCNGIFKTFFALVTRCRQCCTVTQLVVTLHFISTLLSVIQVSIVYLHISSNTVCFTQLVKQFHKCLRQSAVIHFVTEYWAFLVSTSRKVIWRLAVLFKSFLEIQHVFSSFNFNNLNTLEVYRFHCWIT